MRSKSKEGQAAERKRAEQKTPTPEMVDQRANKKVDAPQAWRTARIEDLQEAIAATDRGEFATPREVDTLFTRLTERYATRAQAADTDYFRVVAFAFPSPAGFVPASSRF